MSLQSLCLPEDAIWVAQRTYHFSVVYVGHISDLVEKCIEVFMDNFLVFWSSYETCLQHLELVLKKCIKTNFVLNWQKFFLVIEGIVLGHMILAWGIKVDQTKIDVIEQLPPPRDAKIVKNFLRHIGFYRKFIKDFSNIARPFSKLLARDVPFHLNNECLKDFELLKERLVTTHIIIAPNWGQEFELMCDVVFTQ